MTKIYLTRHGQTKNNLENRYTGWQNIPLNPHGFSQAESSAQSIKARNIDLIISTPLLRAKQTAEEFAEVLNCPLLVVEQLKERSCGLFAGKTKSEVREEYSVSYKEYIEGFTPPEGESIDDVKKRIFACMQSIICKHQNETILIVAHSFVSKVINAFLMNLDDEEMMNFKLKNCEIVSYDPEDCPKALTSPVTESNTKKVDIAI